MQRNLRGMMQHMRAETIHHTKHASEAHHEALWDRVRRVLQVCKTAFRCFTCHDVVVPIQSKTGYIVRCASTIFFRSTGRSIEAPRGTTVDPRRVSILDDQNLVNIRP
jgi:hypothetical protein